MKSICYISTLPLLLTASALLGQGNLAPTAAPGQTMKSLQNLWDKLTLLETKNAALEAQNIVIMERTSLMQQQLGLVRASFVLPPWIFSGVGGGSESNSADNTDLAYGPDGQPAITYTSQEGGNRFLKITRFNGSVWNTQVIDNEDITYNSLAFAPDGRPSVAYYTVVSANLMYAHYNGASWDRQIVDELGDKGKYCSLAFGQDGRPAISYIDGTNLRLKFARHNGSSWTVTTVDNTSNSGGGTSLAFYSAASAGIAYYQSGVGDLKYARLISGSWSSITIDATGDVGKYPSLAFVPISGEPCIAYSDDTEHRLKFAKERSPWIPSSPWDKDDVEFSAWVGNTSLAFGPDGRPSIAYYDYGAVLALRLARFRGESLSLGGEWESSTVDGPAAGGSCALQFNPSGYPAIAYVDFATHSAKFAEKRVSIIASP